MTVEYRDERDAHEDLEWDAHEYRVVFWTRQEPDEGYAQDEMGWSAVIHDLTAEDVHEVIEWADRKAAPDEIYTLHVRRVQPPETTLLHVAGADPTRIEQEFKRTHPLRA